jgi:hypothetical protein
LLALGWLVAAALLICGETLYAYNQFEGDGAAFPETWFLLVTSFAVSAMGLLVLAKMPRHVIGWLLFVIGILLSGSYVLDEYAMLALQDRSGGVPIGPYAATLEQMGAIAFGLTAALLFLLFPDGRVPSPRWRPLLYAGCAAIVVFTVAGLLLPGDLGEPFEEWRNPLGIPGMRNAFGALTFVGLFAVAACGIAGLASLVVRFRQADGVERRQLEWVFFGGAFLAVCTISMIPLRVSGVISDSAESIIFAIGFTAVPVTVGVAILRYHLYDIDWIINRSLVYVPLTAFLAGLYVAMTGLLRTVFTEWTDRGSDAAIAISTLLVASLLTPARNFIQAWVDKHFKETSDPARDVQRIVSEARAVLQVLQQEAFCRRYLRELLDAFDSPGGALQINDDWYLESDMEGEGALQADLIYEGRLLGRLLLAERPAPYTQKDRSRFEELAGMLAETIALRETVFRGQRILNARV